MGEINVNKSSKTRHTHEKKDFGKASEEFWQNKKYVTWHKDEVKDDTNNKKKIGLIRKTFNRSVFHRVDLTLLNSKVLEW